MPNAHFKSQIYRIEIFLLYNSFVCLMACLPAIRPGCTMARAPVFSHDTCISTDSRICCSEEDSLTVLCSIFSSFLPFVSSSISLTEGEKWYKEGVNEPIENYAKPYKDRILSVSFCYIFELV